MPSRSQRLRSGDGMSSEGVFYFPENVSGLAEGDRRRTEAVEQPRLVEAVSDETLLSDAGKGSKDALGQLYRRLARPIFVIAARILRDDGEAEDLVHEVFLALYRHAHRFDPARGSARTWVIHMAYTRALTRRTHLASRKHYHSDELVESLLRRTHVKGEDFTVDAITAQQLMECLPDLLPPEQRRTLEMYFRDGVSLREIAEATNTPVGTIRTQYYRGCDRLRTHILKRKDTKRE